MFRILTDKTSYDFGVPISITDTFSKKLLTTPIPSMPVDRTFAIETEASIRMSIEFVRKNPENFNDESSTADSALWCNGTWLTRVSTLTDRWQARTNGYTLVIDGTDAGLLGVPNMNERVFISSISYKVKEGTPDVIYGSMDLILTNQLKSLPVIPSYESSLSGIAVPDITSYTKSDRENNRVYRDDEAYIMISDSAIDKWYLIQMGRVISDSAPDYAVDSSRQTDIVKSYTIFGGPSTPFEYLTMTLSRKALIKQCPALAEDIYGGCNQLLISSLDGNSMTVTKVSTNSRECKITAYCNQEKIRGKTLQTDTQGTAEGILNSLLNTNLSISPGTEKYIQAINPNGEQPVFTIKAGTNVWTAIQLCAMVLHAKPFFSRGRFYLIDYTYLVSEDVPPTRSDLDWIPRFAGVVFDTINLHEDDSSSAMNNRVAGDPTLGNEGLDTLYNTVILPYWPEKDSEGNPTNITPLSKSNNTSFNTYTENAYTSLDLRNYITAQNSTTAFAVATMIANYILDYRAEPQTHSIKFTMKERSNVGAEKAGWQFAFPTVMTAKKIVSPTDDFTVSGLSVLERYQSGRAKFKPQLLYLSSFERNYPDFTSEYTFGKIEDIDLSQSTSNIMSAVKMN